MSHILRQTSFVLLVLTCLFGCQKAVQSADEEAPMESSQVVNQLLNATQFAAKIEALNNEVIVDVRTSSEVESGMIENAIHIDYRSDDFKEMIQALDKSKPTMVYCAGGGRSGKTAAILRELGFIEVYDLEGGMSSWNQ